MFYKDLILSLIGSLMLIIFLLVGIAFLTLLERKVLGYVQFRKGPNKVGILGVFQPLNDAIKLFSKEQTYPSLSNFLMYYFCPIISLFLSLLIWMLIPYFFKMYSFNLGLLFFLCILSFSVYSIMVAGWASNSSYSLLGGLRAVAQTISYEVSFSLILLSLIFLILSLDFFFFFLFQKYLWLIMVCLPLSFCLLASSLAETNRAPFDFAEGESELVSGFNVEYSSGGFAMIFLSEYSMILFMSMMFSMMMMGAGFKILMFLKMSLITFMFIWIRGTFPRFRYDKLMNLAWKSYLPFSLNFIVFFMFLKLFMLNLVF